MHCREFAELEPSDWSTHSPIVAIAYISTNDGEMLRKRYYLKSTISREHQLLIATRLKMQFSQSQSRFLDSVQDALRRYDSQLKDINHKVKAKVHIGAYWVPSFNFKPDLVKSRACI
jgi:hypothetical protein